MYKIIKAGRGRKDLSKLVKKQVIDKRGRRTTVWVRMVDSIKEKAMDILRGFFGREAEKKISDDYRIHNIKEKFDVSLDEWKDHILNYFLNKKLWDGFFTKKNNPPARVKSSKKYNEKGVGSLPKGEKTKKAYSLSLMKHIHDIYSSQFENGNKTGEVFPESLEEKNNQNKISENIVVPSEYSKEQKKEIIENENIEKREGYYNEKPAEILNVGVDVWGAARHKYDTYERLNANISQMEKDGTAQAYVNKKNLLGDYGLANKDERVSKGETEYKVMMSYLVRDAVKSMPPDDEASRQKYIEFLRAINRIDQETTTAVQFTLSLSEYRDMAFPDAEISRGLNFGNIIGDVLDIVLKNFGGIKGSVQTKFYHLDKKDLKKIKNISQCMRGEAFGEASYNDILKSVFGAVSASGIKVKKGDAVVLTDKLKNRVKITKTEILDSELYKKLREEMSISINSFVGNSALFPSAGEKYRIRQTLQDYKGNLKSFDDIVDIEKTSIDHVSYKGVGGSGYIGGHSFMKGILSGTIIPIDEISDDKKKNIEKFKENHNRISKDIEKTIKKIDIFPEEKGQVHKAGKESIEVSFKFPDGKVRLFNLKPTEIEHESIESVKKEIKNKKTKRFDLYIESKVKRVGGKSFKEISTGDAQKILANDFMFKSVQYGNSMPDVEREKHTIWAVEAFSDMSDILNLPIQQITLNGKLGIAFGARGSGIHDHGAIAHYEGSTKMINLTRASGYGSLAHEWAHFFDNILSEKGNSFISDAPKYEEKEVDALTIKHGSIFEKKIRSRGKDVIERYFYDSRKEHENYPFAKLANGQFEIGDKHKDYFQLYQFKNGKIKVKEPVNVPYMDVAKNISELARENLKNNIKIENEKMGIPVNFEDYEYFLRLHECFARAFEGYISNKLAEQKRENTYLVSLTKTISGDGAFIYPQGDDREKINILFDKFFDLLRGSDELKKAIDGYLNRILKRAILIKSGRKIYYRMVS